MHRYLFALLILSAPVAMNASVYKHVKKVSRYTTETLRNLCRNAHEFGKEFHPQFGQPQGEDEIGKMVLSHLKTLVSIPGKTLYFVDDSVDYVGEGIKKIVFSCLQPECDIFALRSIIED